MLVAPALLWTLAFFLLPLVIMAVYSLWQRVGSTLVTTLSLTNYIAFFERSYFLQARIH
jgi:spermidine/putrescine transport system permease protein